MDEERWKNMWKKFNFISVILSLCIIYIVIAVMLSNSIKMNISKAEEATVEVNRELIENNKKIIEYNRAILEENRELIKKLNKGRKK